MDGCIWLYLVNGIIDGCICQVSGIMDDNDNASSTYGMHNHSMLSWLFGTNRKDCVVGVFHIVTGFCADSMESEGLAILDGCFHGVMGDSWICVGTGVYLICRSVMTWSPPLCMQLSRNVISVGETWEVNLIVAWC